MAGLLGSCPASTRWMGQRLNMAAARVQAGCTRETLPATKAKVATWTAAYPTRTITQTARMRVTLPGQGASRLRPFTRAPVCPGCDRSRRWYASTPSKPPANDSSSPIILPPPQTTSSSPASSPTPPSEKDVAAAETTTEETIKPETKQDSDGTSPESTENSKPSPSSTWSLPSYAESRRTALSERFSVFMDDLQSRFVNASQALSDLTGYTAIEEIKARNAQLETDLAAAQAELRVARRAYQSVNERRAATQREVTTLLARKDSWAPPDLERFTALYRQDHELEAGAQRAVERLKEAEADESRLSAALTSGILKRYHEEQVWSDRIRRQSTWGTWGLMGINIVLFIVLQFFTEPWRRRRLMRGIAEAESGVLEDVRKELADVRAVLASVATSGTYSSAESTARADAAEAAVEAAESALGAATLAVEEMSGGTAAASTGHHTPAAHPAHPPQAAPVAATAADAPSSLASPVVRLPLFSASWPWSWHDVKAFGSDPTRWKAWALDLYSERTVSLRMRDVSLLALQSAAAGAAVIGSILLAFRRT